jgi:hypothetical protein
MTCVRSGFAPRANFDAGHSLSQFDVSANAQNAGATFASSFDTGGTGSTPNLTPRGLSQLSAHARAGGGAHRHRWRGDAASAQCGTTAAVELNPLLGLDLCYRTHITCNTL